MFAAFGAFFQSFIIMLNGFNRAVRTVDNGIIVVEAHSLKLMTDELAKLDVTLDKDRNINSKS